DFGLPSAFDLPARVVGLSEEHGHVLADEGVEVAPGERIRILPSHGDTTINLHERYYAARGDRVEAVWPIVGRGKFVSACRSSSGPVRTERSGVCCSSARSSGPGWSWWRWSVLRAPRRSSRRSRPSACASRGWRGATLPGSRPPAPVRRACCTSPGS